MLGFSIRLSSHRNRICFRINYVKCFYLVVSTIALVYLLMQLVKAKKQGRFLQTIRDLFIILLAILMTAAIFYIGFRFFRAF